jgi:proteasome lid subunit RPN8/RPN11
LDASFNSISTIEKVKSKNNDKVIKSIEFEEFIQANIELLNAFKKLDSIPKYKHLRNNEQDGITFDGRKYKKVSINKEMKLFQHVLFKRDVVIKKFPKLTNTSRNEIKCLMLEAVSKSEVIKKKFLENGLINKKKQNVRQKVGVYEGNGIYAFDDVNEAFLNAMFYSMISGTECAGYVLANGTAVLYINPNGQETSGSYPVPFRFECNSNVGVAIYYGQEVITTYHTHPDGSTSNYSTTDNISQIQHFQDCPMIILYEGAAYYYNYNNGYNNGTPSAIWYY